MLYLGAATKKVDNDMKMYESMAKRNIPKIDTDNTLKLQLLFAEQVEKELATQNQREEKGIDNQTNV